MEKIKQHRIKQPNIADFDIESRPKRKRKVLWLSDYACATGFGQVAHNIMRELHKTGLYEFDVIGINYHGGYVDPKKYPIYNEDFRLYPAFPQGRKDMFGRELLLTALANRNKDIVGPWDLVFTLNDPFIVEPIARNIAQLRQDVRKQMPEDWWFRWIGYWPVDAPTKQNWITKSVAQSDFPVAYCNYGREQMLQWDEEGGIYEWLQESNKKEKVKGDFLAPELKNRLSIIRHGTNTKDFYPLTEKETNKYKKMYFGDKIKEDDFVIANVSRNQPRKDMARTLRIFAEFQKKVPNSFLYLHARVDDVGGNLLEMARQFDIDNSRWGYPQGFNEGRGYPIEFVNRIYNIADVCLSSTLGEGWGLMATEAMACKTPIVGPAITSFKEIFNCENGFDPEIARGVGVQAGSTSSEWICLGATDNERIRPLMNVDDAVSKLYWVYKNKDKVKKITDRAYKWATELTWENECQKWVKLFDVAYKTLEQERLFARKIREEEKKKLSKVGRNDPCPCGSGKKFKKCCGR